MGIVMITISACLIVKNEEKVLSRCLDSLTSFADEIIIVDTGSSDDTMKIAKKYTDKIYDYIWIDDFADARNFSFSKATKDYIYVADADEIIDPCNQDKILQLKQTILPEIEIVQMIYANQLHFNTTYNYDKEKRPKLYKRLRSFLWIDPIHESVALEPVIFDSDIEIIHMPESSHASRDFRTFLKIIERGETLSKKLLNMYARELFIVGNDEDFVKAEAYFLQQADIIMTLDDLKIIQCVLAKCARINKNLNNLFKFSLKNMANGKASAEVCYEVGEYFYEIGDYLEATIWFYNAAYETECELNIHYGGDYPLKRLSQCYHILGDEEQANTYETLTSKWKEDN